MSSGEAEIRYDSYDLYNSLDAFRRCEIDGCLWNVHLPEMRCSSHGGAAVAQYATGAEGDILATRHVVVTQDFDG